MTSINISSEAYADIIVEGLKMIQRSRDGIVLSMQDEADANNEADYMQTYTFLDGKSVDLCVKADSKRGYVEVFDINTKQVKTLEGNVKILRWDPIPSFRGFK